MQKVRNCAGKLVCRIDAREKMVEIVQRGIRTVIRFLDDGSHEIKSAPLK
ncbi:MAG: hypothetical protein ACOX4Y_07680 [Limnochordia bacterium]